MLFSDLAPQDIFVLFNSDDKTQYVKVTNIPFRNGRGEMENAYKRYNPGPDLLIAADAARGHEPSP